MGLKWLYEENMTLKASFTIKQVDWYGYMYILRYLNYMSGNIGVWLCECVYGLYKWFMLCRVNVSCEWLEWLYGENMHSERYVCDMGFGYESVWEMIGWSSISL